MNDHLINLNPVGHEIRALGIAEANSDYQQVNRLRKKLIKMQDIESEISTHIQSQRANRLLTIMGMIVA
jgi:hypothetical protein